MDRDGLAAVPEAAPQPTAAEGGARKGSFRALRSRPFRLYFAGQVVSASGTFLQHRTGRPRPAPIGAALGPARQRLGPRTLPTNGNDALGQQHTDSEDGGTTGSAWPIELKLLGVAG
jgi:hypothetical protein